VSKVSIIIPTYNNAQYLDETLRSIYNQSFTDCEIIVVDDGSKDNTQDVLQKHEGKIRHIYQDNSGGCSKPRNEGIKTSNGEYITIFDADDVMEPDKVKLQSDFLDACPYIDFVFTDFCNFKGKKLYERHTSTCPKFQLLQKRKVGDYYYIIDKKDAYNTLFFENYISAPSMMFRAGLLKEIGFFDETLNSSEDIDFSFRVTLKKDIGYIDKVCFLRRKHDTSMSTRTEAVLTRKILVREKQLNLPKDKESQVELMHKLAGWYASLAYFYRVENKLKSSLACSLKSIQYRPFKFKTYLGLVKTLVTSSSLNFAIKR
jgi:glycosyltransferase involved in cell wall biosynthesis